MDNQENLKDYCGRLIEIINKSNEAFEKQLTYISGGGLALSFVLIDKVLKDISKTQYRGLLIVGWALLAITLTDKVVTY
ncbi:MAG TPA: hypothetical protein VN721_04180 [Flavipsychrobacter sp.]|nr:hypothetical protein [Flavipsychrobacter sp.]